MKKIIGCLMLIASISFSANAARVLSPLEKEKANAIFLYEKEKPTEADLIKSITIFEKHSESDPKMRYYLGLANIEGKTPMLSLSLKKGNDLIKEAAILGDKSAQYHFAMEQIKSNNLTDGIKNLQKSAKSGFGYSQYELGKMYYKGNGVTKNRQAGFKLIKLAADKDIADAQYDLAKIYFSQENNDLKKGGVYWLVSAVKNGKPSACEDLYKLYKEGVIVDRDIKKHIHYLKCSAGSGDIEATKLLANYLQTGTFVSKNTNEAMYWYKKAADKKDPESAFIYAKSHLKSNPRESVAILISIASKSKDASLLLGKIYKHGYYNQRKSRRDAIRYFETAKSLGSKEAIEEIISMTD